MFIIDRIAIQPNDGSSTLSRAYDGSPLYVSKASLAQHTHIEIL